MNVPWLIVPGFGAHIKATPKRLVVQRDGRIEEYPISSVRHLLVMGGHSVHSSAVINLVNAGASISFFEADGEPTGFIRPFGDTTNETVRDAQRAAFPHSYALVIAQASIKSRIFSVERLQEKTGDTILYEGELEILSTALSELEYLVRIDEIRRIHRLVSDMYYEILSRVLPAELGFRRRTKRPHTDVVNAMFSIGYGMLFGNACVAAVGAHLDPGIGFLHRGKGALVQDVIDPFCPAMVDSKIISLASAGISREDFDCTGSRCILSDELVRCLTRELQGSIDQARLDAQMVILHDSLLDRDEFHIILQQDAVRPGRE
ncbi:MAG: CRISPR-associated endonuclease Cas1 [Methanoregulaceae archaeon]